MKELLLSLCTFDGVSGNEFALLDHIANMILPFADKVYFDRIGNLVAFKKGRNVPKKKVVFAAHADEVGLVVKHIEEDGTLLFTDIGILASSLPTRRVFVGKKRLPGVIGSKPIHLIPKTDRAKQITYDELYIDIGASSREEAEKYVRVGDYVSFDSECVMLSDNILKAKAIDDRAGCAVLIGLIKSELEYDTYFVFTRREELGTLGAISAANELCPDICIVCESTTASDIYGTPDMKKVVKLGNGVALPFMDGGTLYTKRLFKLATALADKNGIKWQTKTMVAGGTDARSFQREGHGCEVLGVALPTRYIHSSAGVCNLDDFAAQNGICHELSKILGGIEL
ncbi:MAG: M42 family metallopeptidase [Ruminococcaceae bacterium]|nr:M42 family metallopeptidase [Oscillospiraceae bacterium]